MSRAHVIVSGRVQGVGFRWFVRDRARRLGLCGWVANLDEGRVEVSAEGDVAAIDELIVCLRQGPSSARVGDVIVERDGTSLFHAADRQRVTFGGGEH